MFDNIPTIDNMIEHNDVNVDEHSRQILQLAITGNLFDLSHDKTLFLTSIDLAPSYFTGASCMAYVTAEIFFGHVDSCQVKQDGVEPIHTFSCQGTMLQCYEYCVSLLSVDDYSTIDD